MSEQVQAEQISQELLFTYYKKVLELRLFELKVQELYRNARLPGFVHLYVGEEAVAVGVCSHLETADLVFSTHRGHGHALAKGVPAGIVLAELWGKTTGSSGDAVEACTYTRLSTDLWARTELLALRFHWPPALRLARS